MREPLSIPKRITTPSSATVFRYLDEIHMMCYDFHGAWETFTGHNAPLYRNPSIDTDGDNIVFNTV